MSTLYTARATATGNGRSGHTRSDDGVLDLELAIPKELGGAGGAATNPEQLFAAGYAACFHSALLNVARIAKINLTGSAVTADVGIGKNEAGTGYGLTVGLTAELEGVDSDVAEQLVAKAHHVCPYSNATRGNIEVTLLAKAI